MIKLVIIDFDDTLSLTEEAYFEIENHIAEKLGFSPMTREAHIKNWGEPVREAIIERFPGIDPDEFMNIFIEVMPGFLKTGKADVINERNIETIKKLKSGGKQLAILTSRSFQEVRHLLDKSHHLNKWITKIYHADNSEYLKPNPKVFNQILEDFSVQPKEAVYIGDSIGDAISAKGAGIHFIALLESGIHSKKYFNQVPVDFFAQTFPRVISYIEKN